MRAAEKERLPKEMTRKIDAPTALPAGTSQTQEATQIEDPLVA